MGQRNVTEPNRIDLDEKRAARAEAAGPQTVITLGGKDHALPQELPLGVLDLVDELNTTDGDGNANIKGKLAAIAAVVDGIVGPGTWDGLRAATPPVSLPDVEEFIELLLESYGITVGNSDGSPAPSESTTTPSSQTSPGTTASTSEQLSGAPETPAAPASVDSSPSSDTSPAMAR